MEQTFVRLSAELNLDVDSNVGSVTCSQQKLFK